MLGTDWVRISLKLENGQVRLTDPIDRWIAQMALRDFGEFALPFMDQRVIEAVIVPHRLENN